MATTRNTRQHYILFGCYRDKRSTPMFISTKMQMARQKSADAQDIRCCSWSMNDETGRRLTVSRFTGVDKCALIIEFPKERGRKCKKQTFQGKPSCWRRRKECGDEAVMRVGSVVMIEIWKDEKLSRRKMPGPKGKERKNGSQAQSRRG